MTNLQRTNLPLTSRDAGAPCGSSRKTRQVNCPVTGPYVADEEVARNWLRLSRVLGRDRHALGKHVVLEELRPAGRLPASCDSHGIAPSC